MAAPRDAGGSSTRSNAQRPHRSSACVSEPASSSSLVHAARSAPGRPDTHSMSAVAPSRSTACARRLRPPPPPSASACSRSSASSSTSSTLPWPSAAARISAHRPSASSAASCAGRSTLPTRPRTWRHTVAAWMYAVAATTT
eukprot:scaffold52016_cov45-Phaeocystis_antarctica.AAC.1